MPGIGIIITTAWLVGNGCALVPESAVTLEERAVRIRDVVDISCLAADLKGDIADMIVATLPANAEEITLPRSAMMTLIRRRVPGLKLDAVGIDESMTLRSSADAHSAPPQQRCSLSSHHISAGEIVTQADLVPGACEPDGPRPPLHFDRVQHVTRATADIQAGTSLGAVLAPGGVFDVGDTLDLSIAIGAVRIERQVEAMQPGTPGQDIFVREASGKLISTPTRAHSKEQANAP